MTIVYIYVEHVELKGDLVANAQPYTVFGISSTIYS